MNPEGIISFTVSPDHARVVSYKAGWFLRSALTPVQIDDIGLPPVVADRVENFRLPARPQFGTFELKLAGAAEPSATCPAPCLGQWSTAAIWTRGQTTGTLLGFLPRGPFVVTVR